MSAPKVIKPNGEGGEELVLLPTTQVELDEFVASITDEFGLPPGIDTYDSIATAILHMPNTKAYAPRWVFGHGVLKAMANAAAYTKLEEFRRAREAKAVAEKEKMEAERALVGAADGQPIQDA